MFLFLRTGEYKSPFRGAMQKLTSYSNSDMFRNHSFLAHLRRGRVAPVVTRGYGRLQSSVIESLEARRRRLKVQIAWNQSTRKDSDGVRCSQCEPRAVFRYHLPYRMHM